MRGVVHSALTAARPFAEALLDALRPTRRVPRVRPAARRPRLVRGRTRAVFLLARMVEALGIPWSCRRTAFAVYRAFVREGVPARLCFGIRRGQGGRYVGHVWASPGLGCEDAGPEPVEFPLRVELPAVREDAGWRRG